MKLIVICGPTASGKSDVAVKIATELGAEIMNADSMQIYKGMDIGTAKLGLEERAGIPHHLLDVIDVRSDATVAWYQEIARATISEIHGSGKDAVVVGGTGLYIKAILDEMNFPETDPVVRARLELEAVELGVAELFTRLERLDPAAAASIDRANSRRVIRALEVIEITGKPFTANLPREESSLYPHARQFALRTDREVLRERVSARVDDMWNKGFISEVEALVNDGIREGVTAQKAIGYAQILQFLSGEISEEQALEDTKVATRQYIRRQETWFNRDERIDWLESNSNAATEILKKINS